MTRKEEYESRSYVKSMFIGHILVFCGLVSAGTISAIGGALALYACIRHFRDSRKRIEEAKRKLDSLKTIRNP